MIIAWDQNPVGLFQKGGFAMWPLLICSVVMLAITLERTFFYLRTRLNEAKFKEKLAGIIRRQNYLEAVKLTRKSHPVAVIAQHYLANLDYADSVRSTVLKREGSIQLERCERNLKGLSTVAHLAPLLGLLGTVTGLVGAFHQIERLGGQVQPADLASGIWEALLTTVFGLIIAIPAAAFFHYFENKADAVSRRMQYMISELDERFGKVTEKDGSAKPARENEAYEAAGAY